jgi:hypothetical protein
MDAIWMQDGMTNKISGYSNPSNNRANIVCWLQKLLASSERERRADRAVPKKSCYDRRCNPDLRQC